MTTENLLILAAIVFSLGAVGVMVRRNALVAFMSVELMLNAVNLVLVTADTTVKAVLPHSGQVFALFVLTVAAAESAIGLAIVVVVFRNRGSIAVEDINLMKG